MKQITVIILALALGACAKQPAIKPVVKTDPVYSYNYNLDVLTSRDDSSGAQGDTLIIKINGTIVVNKTGLQIPEYISNLKIKTGDRLYIYSNPGMIGETANYNRLECFLTGGYKNPKITLTGYEKLYDQVIKE